MKLSRRTLIKTGSVTAVAALASVRAAAGEAPALTVFDSRIAQSRAFANAQTGLRIDVAHEDANFWRALRAGAPAGRIIGLTAWSDLVVVRGLLEEKGKRLKSEQQLGKSHLLRWEMG
jgi:hypothetical protein